MDQSSLVPPPPPPPTSLSPGAWFAIIGIFLAIIYFAYTQYMEKVNADKAAMLISENAAKAAKAAKAPKDQKEKEAKEAKEAEIIKINFLKAFEEKAAADAKAKALAEENAKSAAQKAKDAAEALATQKAEAEAEAKAAADTKAAADAKAKADADAAAANKAKAEADAKAKAAADAQAKADADAAAAKKSKDEKAAAAAAEAKRIADKNAYDAMLQKQEADKKAADAAAEQKKKDKEKAALEENLKAVALMAAAAVLDEINRAAVKAIVTKVGRQQAAKIAYKGAAVGLRVASKVFAKLGISSASKLALYGLKAGTKAAEIAAEQAIKAAAKTAGKAGAKQLGKSAFYAVPGLGQAMLAFDILSFALDVGDGGGYGKMGTIKQYKDMKAEAEKQLQAVFDELGVLKPSFKGPEIDFAAVSAELEKRMNDDENPIMKEMKKKMSDKISEDMANNVYDETFAKYTSYIDSSVIQNQILKEMCDGKSGKFVDIADPMSMYVPVEKSKQDGKLISAFSQKSLPFCEIECQKAKCKSFTHRQANGEDDVASNCWLYSDSTKAIANADTTVYNKIKDVPDNMQICTFTKDACEKSFSWPLKENEEYGEYRSVKINTNINGKITENSQDMCVSSDSLMRTVCDSNNIPYDTTTGICKIDAKYCAMKGADWLQDEQTKEFDCAISPGQGFAEALFGTTITRGLKQIFDLSQYEKCKDNETDDGYFCRNTNACDPAKNQEACLGLCYPKCKAGFHPVGCNICSPDCPPSSGSTVITDDGAFCRTQKCKDTEEKSGELCYPKCKDGYYGVGPVCWEKCPSDFFDFGVGCNKDARKDPCPPNMRDDGTSCWLDTLPNGVGTIPLKTPCPANMRDDGTSCWLDTLANGVGTIPLKTACPANMRDDWTSCWLDTYGRGAGYTNWFESWDEQLKRCERSEGTACEWNGAIAYPKCKAGYHSVGCCLCEPDGGPGIKKTLFDRQYCAPGETNIAGLCYKNCKPGYRFFGGNLCEPIEGFGIKKTLGARQYCAPGETNVVGLCYKNCKPGYHFAGGNLCEPDGGFGIKKTLMDRQHCDNPKSTNILGKCNITKATYGRTAGTIPETTIVAKAAPEGRGVGTPAVTIRTKNRIVEYSSKQNALRMNAPIKKEEFGIF